MNELSLFTGAGGGVLGTKLLGWTTLGYVEFNEYCQKVLSQRIRDGILDEAPIFSDIRAFISEGYAASYTGMVDVITAGFPCQPFSVAGKQQGENDPRNMWPQTIECIRIIRPQFALLENVPGLLAHPYARRIFGDLAESGYDARWRVLSAAEVGAPHKRERVWVVCRNTQRELADAKSGEDIGRERGGMVETAEQREGVNPATEPCGEDVADTEGKQSASGPVGEISSEKQGEFGRSCSKGDLLPDTLNNGSHREEGNEAEQRGNGKNNRIFVGNCEWPTEPDVGRVANGVANRVDRLKALGNGQVSRVVATAWEILTE